MTKKKLSIGAASLVGSLAISLAAPLAHAQTTATWDGSANDGLYSTDSNWDINIVPLNNGGTFNVIISNNADVAYNIAGTNAINGLQLDPESELRLRRPDIFTAVDFSILNLASIGGFIDADAANLTVNGAVFNGNSARVSATDGANVAIDASGAYSTLGLGHSQILNANGMGSKVDLSSLEAINAGFNTGSNNIVHTVNADNEGVVDLSAVTQVTTPVRFNSRIDFVAKNDANIDLRSLEMVKNDVGNGAARFQASNGGAINLTSLKIAQGSTGVTEFNVDNGTINVGPLEEADQINFEVSGSASSLTVGGFNGSAQINNSTVQATNGAVFDGSTLRAAYSTVGLGHTQILNASGTGSKVDLSAVETINAGFSTSSNNIVHTVNAENEGVVDLSAVTQVTTPARFNNRIDFVAQNDASIDLRSLETIDSAGSGAARFQASNGGAINLTSLKTAQGSTGVTEFNVDNGTINVGPLEEADQIDFHVTASTSSLTVGGFNGSAQINNSTVQATNGAVFDGSTLRAAYSTVGLGHTQILNASGTGSKVDLSAVETINAGFSTSSNNIVHTVNAENEGVVDLSAVTQVTTPARFNNRIDFVAQNDASIDLRSLETIDSAGSGAARFQASNGGAINLTSLKTAQGSTGVTEFNVDNGTINVGPLEEADQINFEVSGSASSLTVGGFNGSAQINNSTVQATNGAVFDGSTLRAAYSTVGLGHTQILNASGTGSKVDLSAVETINAGFSTSSNNIVHTVNAENEGVVDLSAVTQVTTPARFNNRIDFVAQNDASIDLRSLETIDSAGSGRVKFEANGGSITVGIIDTNAATDITATNSGSSISALNNMILNDSSTLAISDEAVLRIGGNFEFTHTAEASVNVTEGVVHMNGGRNQTLEAGGTDGGAGAFTAGNFGIGQLIVGDNGLATVVQVLDDVSNGNRGAGGELEALYLFGIGNEGEQNEQDGLRILGDSTLMLKEDVNVYALIDADMFGNTDGTRQWEHLNDWFVQRGVNTIAFDGGFISTVPEPTTLAILMMAGLPLLRRRVA